MKNEEQIVNGIVNYINHEIFGTLSTRGKIIIGTLLDMLLQNTHNVLQQLNQNPMAKSFGISDGNGKYDIQTISKHLKANMEKYGKFKIHIPLDGDLSFSSEDVDKLVKYIESEE